jgi:hypothetical protein
MRMKFSNRTLLCITSLAGLLYSKNSLSDEIIYESNTAINRGLLSDSYWKSRSLGETPSKVLSYLDTKLRATGKIESFEIFVERAKVATLVTNTNALYAAATSNQTLEATKSGSYSLNGKVNSYGFDAAGLTFANDGEGKALTWSISPMVVRLNSFTTGSGVGQLEVGTNSQRLSGTVDRQGLTSYGFLTNVDSQQIGIGTSVDAHLSYNIQSNKFDLDVINLASKIPVNGMFHSERSYQVNTLNGELIFGSVPSMTGTYGQENKNLRLPQIFKASWSSHSMQSHWSEKLGVIAFDSNKIIFGELGYENGDHSVRLKSYELQNLFLTYSKSNFLLNKLSVDITMGSAFHSKSQMLITGIKYAF